MNEKPIYTVSVSKLDAFDKWINRQTEENEPFNNEQTFLATLKGVFKQIDHAKYGECFHAIVDGTATPDKVLSDQKQVSVYRYKEAMIPLTQAQRALDYKAEHPLMSTELPISRRFETPQFSLIVTGRIDGLEGNFIRDCKTKYSSPDVQEDYIDSMQWRFYLYMMKLKVFYYDIFQVSGFQTIDDCLKARIKPLEPMFCTAYAGMEQDLQILLDSFAEFITFKGLQQWIEISPISTVAREYGLYRDMVWNDDTILNFGKYRGKRLGDCGQYLQWLHGNQVLPAALKQYMLTKRLIA